MAQALLVVGAVVLGACIGSFLNVVIHRVPKGTFLSGGKRSHCPRCGAEIRWFDNVPLLSWILLLRGRCRNCRERISVRYPLVEALTAAGIAWLFWLVVGQHVTESSVPGWRVWAVFALRGAFLAMLIACTFIDIDHRILPDVLTKPTMALGMAGAAAVPGLVTGFPGHEGDWFFDLLYSMVGLATGYGLTSAIRTGGTKVFGREAMGFGDVKFMGAIGAFVGWDGALVTFFAGSVLGALYGGLHQLVTKEGQIFFGPFLAAGAVVALFFRQPIVEFVTVTWPEWQSRQELSLPVLAAIAAVCMVLLILIIRRGRKARQEEP